MGIGADWDFDLLESLIEDRGEVVIWESAVACPKCRRDDTTVSMNEKNPTEATRINRVNCQNCKGSGLIYRNATAIRGIMTAINAGNRQQMDLGIMQPGDCVFSPSLLAPVDINEMDRITSPIPDVLNEGQVIQRGGATLSNARYIDTSLSSNEDRLWYVGTGDVAWCEDQNNVVYNVNADFKVIDNKISWIGNKPKDGVFFTLKYFYYPEWVVYSSPLQRYDRNRPLANRVALRKKHVMNTAEVDVATVGQRQLEELSLTGRTKL